MKVISGSLKGRNIKGYDIKGTRPTMDRVKESIFGMIQNNLFNSQVLDLFAGSGNYGIEALSNGASFVYFNDHNNNCVKVIEENLESFGIKGQAKVLKMDYLKALEYLNLKEIKFELIFLDPPYDDKCLEKILKYLANSNLLKKGSVIVSEFVYDDLANKYGNLELIKSRTYGEKKVYIYKMMTKDE